MATIENIIKSVRTILDHNLSSTELKDLTEIGTLDLDTIITGSIRPAAMQLMQAVPVELATLTTQKKELTAPTQPPISISLPVDFLRFVSCRIASWNYPVTELKAAGSREHLREFGEFSGLKATAHRPLAVRDGNDVTMYGGTSSRMAELTYIAMPEMTETEISVDDRLYDPLCYIVAALACEVLKDTQKSQYLMQTARSLMTSAEGAEEQQIKANM